MPCDFSMTRFYCNVEHGLLYALDFVDFIPLHLLCYTAVQERGINTYQTISFLSHEKSQ